MPEEQSYVDLGSILENIDDFTLNSKNYDEIQSILKLDKSIKRCDAEKLISICIQDISEDNKKYSINSLNILSFLLNKIQKGQCPSTASLVPSALGVLCTLKTVSSLSNIESLRLLCFEILLMYPKETLTSIAMDNANEIYEIVELYCNSQIPTEVALQPTMLILQLMKILPHSDRTNFVKNGMDFWFSSLIPTIFTSGTKNIKIVEKAVQCLELLTEELLPFDYVDNLKWVEILGCIYVPQKYPSIMKSLLEDGYDHWHKLWMVCVKLLKNQITKNVNSAACPINSMLPVVETAFKMDVKNRCRAFKCWNVLIDNFASETNEVYMNKRVKLLLIPLISNNAKVEETALAKFNTWYHFITRFHKKMNKFADTVLLPFLQFCFGKPALSNKPVIIPGLFSEETKKLSVQCFTNIFAHYDCPGCVDIQTINNKLITTTHLVTNWKHWINSLSTVIKIGSDIKDETVTKQVRCAWKSFVATVGELPENNIRRDLFMELLAMLQKSLQECQVETSEIVINVLLPALFEDENIKSLIKFSPEHSATIVNIFSILTDQSNNNFYSRCDINETIKNVRYSTDYLVQESIKTSSCVMETILKDLPTTESSLILWTAFAESIVKYEYITQACVIFNLILWPLKLNLLSNEKKYISTWQALYDLLNSKIMSRNINDEILQYFAANKQINTIFSQTAILKVLQQILSKEKDSKFEKKIELVLKVLQKQVDDNKLIQNVFIQLLESIVHLLNRIVKITNVVVTKHLLLIINKLLKVTPTITNLDTKENNEMLTYLEKIILQTDAILKMESYSKLNTLILEGIKESTPYLIKNTNNIKCILSILNTYENQDGEIKKFINELTPNKSVSEENNFTVPNTKSTCKKTTKKEVSIVNTVVENGEEFVVVKSNWKFNPKKLTDNQKEKLQRKREDIPALYQDLSQSQDEFKLTSWKTESNEANSSSKSTSASANDDITSVLKNIPNADIMPKILHNITKKDDNIPLAEKNNTENVIIASNNASPNSLQSTKTKDTKSPRMALKDRVFRNVRNLIEKSNVNEDNKISATINENGSKTPLGVKTNVAANIINSAPSQLNCARPSRVKRPPKKFVDSEVFSIKRRRPSINQLGDCEESDHATSNDETNKCNSNPLIATDIPMDVQTENLDEPLKSGVEEENNLQKNTNKAPLEPKDDTAAAKLLMNNNIPKTNDLDVNVVIHKNKGKDKDAGILKTGTSITKKEIELKNEATTPKSTTVSISKIGTPITTKEKEIKNEVTTPKSTTASISKIGTPITTKEKEINNEVTTPKSTTVNISKIGTPITTKEKEIKDEVTTPKSSIVNISKISTPITTKEKEIKDEVTTPKSSNRKASSKKSRIEKELAIDMVEGHPFLNAQSEKRLTRKALTNSPSTRKKASSNNVNNKSKLEVKTVKKIDSQLKENETNISIDETQSLNIDMTSSQDIIESSQDSSVTTISVRPMKNNSKKAPVKTLVENNSHKGSEKLSDDADVSLNPKKIGTVEANTIEKDDSVLPQNKTIQEESTIIDLTENMDTEPIEINDDFDMCEVPQKQEVDTQIDDICMKVDSQDTANADTQPLDPNVVIDITEPKPKEKPQDHKDIADKSNSIVLSKNKENDIHVVPDDDLTNTSSVTLNDTTKTIPDLTESKIIQEEAASSPFKDDEQRKKDFLNNTLEISPIKILSPVRDDKTPSPETSNDFVVIKLCSPVQDNGEPIEKCNSPEIFTEDKISPDKRDLSPPREEITVTNTSPSSLSLKKNRPQVRTGGRGAQMLGLCVPDRLQKLSASDKTTDNDEAKKTTPLNTSARRNLRILYNTTENHDMIDDNEDSDNFLKFKRNLPTTDCSPSGPILKRKLADIVDEATPSPVSKRKRVSFHDPPVSTTVCVKKYIEPCGVRSPQNSAIKRQERQLRFQNTTPKSQRRLDKALTKTIESFVSENCSEDTQMSSLDQTPVIEVVKTSDLNDTDPICPRLVDCKDSIENIATELSSPAMKSLLVKEFEGKIETIGDLAKLTELEVNRLCIKAPKVETVKKVLNTYSPKKEAIVLTSEIIADEEVLQNTEELKSTTETVNVEEKSDIVTGTVEVQTDILDISSNTTQTDIMEHSHSSVQTDLGKLIYEHDIPSHILERPDILGKIDDKVFETLTDTFVEKLPLSKSCEMIDRIVERQCNGDLDQSQDKHLLFLQEYLCNKFESKDLVLFCSGLLKKVYDKS